MASRHQHNGAIVDWDDVVRGYGVTRAYVVLPAFDLEVIPADD
jgi:hypothetical protein